MKEILKQLKKEIIKDWGKKCEDYHPICSKCVVWKCYEDLKEMSKYV